MKPRRTPERMRALPHEVNQPPPQQYQGPAGAPPAPLRPGVGQGKHYATLPPLQPVGIQAPPLGPRRGRDERRSKGAARRQFRGKLQSWRPMNIYVGAISAATTVGLGSPPASGGVLRRVTLKVRVRHEADATDYWEFGLYLLSANGTEEQVPDTTTETINEGLAPNIDFGAYNDDGGLRVQANQEVVMKFTAHGSPAALSQVQLYADWFVGT